MTIINKMNGNVVNRTEGVHNMKSYLDLHENEYWCDGSDCIAQGFIDDVAEVSCGKSLHGTKEIVITSFWGSFVVIYSQCPLITSPLKIRANNEDDLPLILKNVNFKFESYTNKVFDSKELVWELRP